MKVTIIGHGYVGLVTGAIFSDLGNNVTVIGRTKDKIDALNRGNIPIYEPGLEEIVKRNLKAQRLTFSLEYKESVPTSDVVIIAVGTPSQNNGEADLKSVFDVAQKIAQNLDGFTVVACKSTVPPGTNRKIEELIKKMKPEKASFAQASIPEFLREGTAIEDTLKPDRIVIGVEDEKAKKILCKLHGPLSQNTLVTNIETAEMIKYTANSFLANKISFANAISFLCEKTGADVEKVMEGIGLDKRIGKAFLKAGVGYGGSCFPKDVKALIHISKNLGYNFKLLKEVESINKQAAINFVKKISKYFKNLRNKTLTILGLSFKPDTDDMRDAPSITIINELLRLGAKIKAYDPAAIENARKIFKNSISLYKDPYQAMKGADALVIITEWKEFRELDMDKVKKLLKTPVIFDGRNIYDREKIKRLDFTYFCIGRQNAESN